MRLAFSDLRAEDLAAEMGKCWRDLSEHPALGHDAPRVIIWGYDCGVQMGHVYRYPNGKTTPRAEGFHGEWNITKWMPTPLGPHERKP